MKLLEVGHPGSKWSYAISSLEILKTSCKKLNFTEIIVTHFRSKSFLRGGAYIICRGQKTSLLSKNLTGCLSCFNLFFCVFSGLGLFQGIRFGVIYAPFELVWLWGGAVSHFKRLNLWAGGDCPAPLAMGLTFPAMRLRKCEPLSRSQNTFFSDGWNIFILSSKSPMNHKNVLKTKKG